VRPVRLVVWSDYLCPWCYNASVRLTKLQHELAGALEIEWRAFLLRPQPRAAGDREAELHRFARYTQSWLRPAAEPDAGSFRVWESGEGPPSHSVPAHLAAKAARRLGPEAFAALHPRLLRAYFAESRDISARPVLEALWRESGLPPEAFAACDDPSLLRQVLAEHADAVEQGASGVPAAKLAGQDAVLVGALPLETYRRWVVRQLRAEPDAVGAV
jgi:predicted DsbA family dithiol-disulfide isomerase